MPNLSGGSSTSSRPRGAAAPAAATSGWRRTRSRSTPSSPPVTSTSAIHQAPPPSRPFAARTRHVRGQRDTKPYTGRMGERTTRNAPAPADASRNSSGSSTAAYARNGRTGLHGADALLETERPGLRIRGNTARARAISKPSKPRSNSRKEAADRSSLPARVQPDGLRVSSGMRNRARMSPISKMNGSGQDRYGSCPVNEPPSTPFTIVGKALPLPTGQSFIDESTAEQLATVRTRFCRIPGSPSDVGSGQCHEPARSEPRRAWMQSPARPCPPFGRIPMTDSLTYDSDALRHVCHQVADASPQLEIPGRKAILPSPTLGDA